MEKGADGIGTYGLGRGGLRIYLGWAPGVGKTRRALLDLVALKAQGVDAVIGWLEGKSRPDLEELAQGVERIPPRTTLRGGVAVPSLDVDALLARHPATVLIDELARETESPGERSRHQEVERLLERGISVLTTMNGLHITELSTPAAQILGHPVRVTVPSDFVRRADELIFVDLPPAELSTRIRSGQIFLPGEEMRASRAFTPANLARLRELTLQFLAKALDANLIRQGGEKGIFERVTLLVSANPDTFRPLLDAGGSLARRLGGELLVLHLEKIPLWGRRFSKAPALPESIEAAVREAGGKLSILRTRQVAWTLWRFIERTQTTRLVLGHAGEATPWRRSLVRAVLRHFRKIDVEITLVPTLHPLPPEIGIRRPTPPDPARSLPLKRGRFTLFLGAAAGIGKTYRMLQEARKRQEDGGRVAIGYLETHGRRETESMARGIPLLTRRRVPYRGLILEEMDLDAILSSGVDLVLVDELAHTNPVVQSDPNSSKNPQRYQDVLQILDAGMDVFSTLNVQHIETLNDLVALQTGIRVRETVPDSIVERADDLVLVDLSPEELRKRLLEGKIYPPEKIFDSLENFFSVRNLTALREFALTSAQGAGGFRIQPGGILLVGVSPRPTDQALIRRGAQISRRVGLELRVLFVRNPMSRELPPPWIEEICRRLGADLTLEDGASWEEAFVRHSHEIRPSLILLGQSAWRPGMISTAEQMARLLTAFPLLIVPLDIPGHRQEMESPPIGRKKRTLTDRFPLY